MNKCKICGSHAINEHLHGREKGKWLDLCDVCYWVKMYEDLKKTVNPWGGILVERN